jgi:hypothetical protein
MIQISALRSRLEKPPTDLRPYASYIRDDALALPTPGTSLPLNPSFELLSIYRAAIARNGSD